MGFNVKTNSYSYANAGLDPQLAAEKAVSVIGQGYDLCNDIKFSACKSKRLIQISNSSSHTRDLVFPSGVVVPNVPLSIKSDKGDCTRFRSDVLTFNQVGHRDHNLSDYNNFDSISCDYIRLFSFSTVWLK